MNPEQSRGSCKRLKSSKSSWLESTQEGFPEEEECDMGLMYAVREECSLRKKSQTQ